MHLACSTTADIVGVNYLISQHHDGMLNRCGSIDIGNKCLVIIISSVMQCPKLANIVETALFEWKM